MFLMQLKTIVTDRCRFLDKSRPASAWRLCTVTQVEQLKCVLRLLPVWASGIPAPAVCVVRGKRGERLKPGGVLIEEIRRQALFS
jgi:hypothetical protein